VVYWRVIELSVSERDSMETLTFFYLYFSAKSTLTVNLPKLATWS